MSEVLLAWYGIWAALLATFAAILWREKKRKLYALYFAFGMAFGFYFDSLSVVFGYYSYAEIAPMVAGVPLSMTVAEGFAVAITIKASEALRRILGV